MSSWYLEHVLTGKRVDLPNGKVTIGRNSACSIVLNYDYMSRRHVEITVRPNKVLVKCLNAANGVFVNGAIIKKKLKGVPVREGDLICLGCPAAEKVSSPAFRLKKGPVKTGEIEQLSDSDDDSTPLPALKPVTEIPNVANDNAASTVADKQTDDRNIHLPKLPQVKPELETITQDIANIFGEADESIIGSILEINPYLYNHLLKEKQAVPISRLQDGQFIELDGNENKPEDPPCPDSSTLSPCPPPPSLGDSDKHMAMSLEVRQDKEKTNKNSSPLSSTNDGDIIQISDSDDEDLHSQKLPDSSSTTCQFHMKPTKVLSSLDCSDPKYSKPRCIDSRSDETDCTSSSKRSRSVRRSEEKGVSSLSKKSKIVKPGELISIDISIEIGLKATKIKAPLMENAEPMEYSSMRKAGTTSVNIRSKENEPPPMPKEYPSKREINTRLRSRATSCYYPRPQDKPNLATRNLNGMDMRRIEAPSVPQYRDKLRGVSAVPKDDNNNNAPCKGKPKAKDMLDDETESFGKLTEQKPADSTSELSGSRKRKATTTVPRVRNANRGAFLTVGIERPNMDFKRVRNRRATICAEGFIQQMQPTDFLPSRNGCPPERKDAENAINRRTSNRVTFASMEKDLEEKLRFQNMSKKKGDELLYCSTYVERRKQWSRDQVNDSASYVKSILKWANQWLKQRNVGAVVDSDVLKPIADEFETVKQYKKIFVPLMKLDLLTTIKRDYKLKREPIEVHLQHPVEKIDSFYCLTTRVFTKPTEKCMLYTLSSGKKLKETFAILRGQRTENDHELIFEILTDGISLETFKGIKLLTARPVVDNLDLELGALQAVDQLSHSPLHRKIIKPTEMLKNTQIPGYDTPCVFKGLAKLNPQQEAICSSTYQRVIHDEIPSITLIQSSTDAGKSLIANISMQCLYGRVAIQKDRKILICSHSNTAVDSIVFRLHNVQEKYKVHMLRYGPYEKMNTLSRQYSLERKYQSAEAHKKKRVLTEKRANLQQRYNDLKVEVNLMKKKKKHDGPRPFDMYEKKVKQMKALEEQLNPRLTYAEKLDIAKSHIEAANIVCTTLSSCVELGSLINYFDICLIDEATQCTEPWTLLPMRFGILHLVLVGDTQQLPADVLSHKAADLGLAKSMFDRLHRSLDKQEVDQPDGHLSALHSEHAVRRERIE
ncbi:probable helicase senataxin isoform X1 [Drosophila pseudoobscura]|uniref:Probable helicase senataxin isoform X1 n=1 Tax=Drosophila pseudoobscura pseudoobscura TaxID=46245 RepID=A0A6I8VQ64_DROPS|nr:probable helicase senataxin isoform X1 [Drosophila pseudoobscura]XP_033233190.1 probable helicase senataxin isoform X1 [Drosophila pseudoobscura]XP_033233191.1 probable helicase senataxin isoform X1 [Drosophila pseudoobscura]